MSSVSVNPAGLESALHLKRSTTIGRDCCLSTYQNQLLAWTNQDTSSLTAQHLPSPVIGEMAAETSNTSTARHEIFFQDWKSQTDSSSSSSPGECPANSSVLPRVMTMTSQQNFIEVVGKTRSIVGLESQAISTANYVTGSSSSSPIDVDVTTTSLDNHRHVTNRKTTMNSEMVLSSPVLSTQSTCHSYQSGHQSSALSWQPSHSMAQHNDASTPNVVQHKAQHGDGRFAWQPFPDNLQMMEGTYDFAGDIKAATEAAYSSTPRDSGFRYGNSDAFACDQVNDALTRVKNERFNDCAEDNVNSKPLPIRSDTAWLGNGPEVNTWRPPDGRQYVTSRPQQSQHDNNPTTSVPERDLDKICRQTAALDHLTVLRLRTECRSRRLPVSGRKRNLVRRLLPFADTILKHVDLSGSCPTSDGCSRSAGLETPCLPMSLIRSSSAPIPSDHVGSPVEPFTRSDSHPSSCDVIRRESDSSYCSAGPFSNPETPSGRPDDALVPGSLRRSSDGTLTDCWMRQQRVIEELRRQLLKYRKALDRVRHRRSTGNAETATDVGPPMSAVEFPFPVDGGESMESVDDETTVSGVTDEYCYYQPFMKDFSSICDEGSDMWSNTGVEGSPVEPCLYFSRVTCERQPPDYYEAVKSLEHRVGLESNVKVEAGSAMSLSDVTRALCKTATGHDDDDMATCHFTIDDVIDVLTSSGELQAGGDQRIQPV